MSGSALLRLICRWQSKNIFLEYNLNLNLKHICHIWLHWVKKTIDIDIYCSALAKLNTNIGSHSRHSMHHTTKHQHKLLETLQQQMNRFANLNLSAKPHSVFMFVWSYIDIYTDEFLWINKYHQNVQLTFLWKVLPKKLSRLEQFLGTWSCFWLGCIKAWSGFRVAWSDFGIG